MLFFEKLSKFACVIHKNRDELENSVQEKNEGTLRQIENYNAVPNKDEQLRLMEDNIRTEGHKKHYCCIVRDSNGRVGVVKNEILEIADRRAWEVSDRIYNNDFSMYRALKARGECNKKLPTAIIRRYKGSSPNGTWTTGSTERPGCIVTCMKMPRCFWKNATLSKGNTRITMMLWEGGL